jgi:hypothetical protein
MRALLIGLVLLAAGCTNYHYIVRADHAPLYADHERTSIVLRMDRLADGYIGHSAPDGDPVKISYHGQSGWANRDDLRIFKYDNDPHAQVYAVWWHRREVVLEGKDWAPNVKQAVRDGRIENGMTKEMVSLAWGRPSAIRPLDQGGEQWIFDRRYYDVYDDVAYYSGYGWYPPGRNVYVGYGPWGPAWGYVYDYPTWEPRYYRTYYIHTDRRSVTFSPQGAVVGWESHAF